MGVVYEAFDPVLQRLVALKTIRLAAAEPAQAQLFEERFLVEARIAARLQHPGIVVVHDVGRDSSTGTLYIALELLRGRTLQDLLNGGPLPWPDAVRLTAGVARALHYAHAEGVIHRDIKPANVMVLPSGEPKIMDFGIARVENARATISSPGEFLGTPLYSSPEQALGQTLDKRTDIFSLGAVAYSALVGRAAFSSSSVPDIVRKVIHVDPNPPSTQRPGLPHALDAVLARALAKSPADRYSTGEELADELEGVLMSASPLTLASARVMDVARDPILEIQTLVSDPTLGGASPRQWPVAQGPGLLASPLTDPPALLAPASAGGPSPVARTALSGAPTAAASPGRFTPTGSSTAPSSVENADLLPAPMSASRVQAPVTARFSGRVAAAIAASIAVVAISFFLLRPEPRPGAPGEGTTAEPAGKSRSASGGGARNDKVLRVPERIALGGESSPASPAATQEPVTQRPTAAGSQPARGTVADPTRSAKLKPAPPMPAPQPSQSEAPARLLVDFGHTLTEAVLTVSVNNDTVIYEEISARVKKTLGVGIVKGEFRKTVDVPPGKHKIRVKLEWDGKTRTDEIDGTFVSGKTRHLDVSLGRIRKNLDLEWK